MNYERLIKLEQLIKSSPILDASEREEWLALLDLMNDKQLLELEKILQTTKNPEIQKPKNLGPNLGHLMNIPSGIKYKPSVPLPAVSPASLLKDLQAHKVSEFQLQKKEASKIGSQKGAFWSRIKDILSEKELKPGHDSLLVEKELLAGNESLKKSGVQIKPVFAPALKPLQAKVTFKPLVPPNPVNRPGFDIPVPRPKSKPQAVPLKLILKQTEVPKQPLAPKFPILTKSLLVAPAKPAVSAEQQKKEMEKYGPKGRSDYMTTVLNEEEVKDSRVLESLKQNGTLGKDDRKLAAGIKLDEVRAKNDSSRLFGSLKGLAQDGKYRIGQRSFEKLNITSLLDLAKLTPDNFAYENFAVLISLLKNFVKDFGYHEVVFTFEKSPLFKAYVDTGTKVLAGEKQFTESESSFSDPDFLKQEDFEKVADMLMELQTA
jgi:hypothetical protein